MNLRQLGSQVKEWFFPQVTGNWGGFLFSHARTDYHYRSDLGDGLSSSVITPVIQWLTRAFPEAPLVVRRRQGDTLEIVDNHPLAQLVERPNNFYSGALLWSVTVQDYCWFGESYWRILRDQLGRPAQLWWMPPWSIEPR